MGDRDRLEEGDAAAGWDYVDGPGKSAFADAEVKHGGKRSLRFENFKAGNEGGNARFEDRRLLQQVPPGLAADARTWSRSATCTPRHGRRRP